MKDKNCDNIQYTCGICGTGYSSVHERAKCEIACVKKAEEEERKAAEAKKKEEQVARKTEVDNALKAFKELVESYTKDYGSYEYEGSTIPSAVWPSKLWHHFWF